MANVRAPYNFVSLSETVYKKEELTKHNEISGAGFSGEIEYEITAQTPIFVDSGKKDKEDRSLGEFHRNAKEKYSIPGSTMRGLIRNNVQILGLCSVADDIEDYHLMYRSVAFGLEKERYNDILGFKSLKIDGGGKKYSIGVLLNVRAGYVKNEHGKYVIYQTAVDNIKEELGNMNYYVLSERKIVNTYLKNQKNFSYEFFIQNGKSILQHEFKPFEKKSDKGRNGKITIKYKGEPNKAYRPYIKEISYDIENEKDVTKVGEPGKYNRKGYVVSTGKMNEKKAVYIIPEIAMEKKKIIIPDEDVKAFQIDINKRENVLEPFGGRVHFDLPQKDGEMRPIFYIKKDNRLYLGFTPRLRIFYDHSIKDGIPRVHMKDVIDYSKSMFGYVSQSNSYKSKLSFSDAVIQGKTNEKDLEWVILAEPKPTSYLDYLKGVDESGVTYNNSNFEIRGIKQYWLHKSLIQAQDVSKKDKIYSKLTPLEAGTVFRGKIRFKNLTKDELGLLLWAVQLENKIGTSESPKYLMNIGKAKSYGYGCVSIQILSAKVVNLEKAYGSLGKLDLKPFNEIDIQDYINFYKDNIYKEVLKFKKIDELLHIKEFFMMKNSELMPNSSDISYMEIKEYPRRKEPLKKVSEVVNIELNQGVIIECKITKTPQEDFRKNGMYVAHCEFRGKYVKAFSLPKPIDKGTVIKVKINNITDKGIFGNYYE